MWAAGQCGNFTVIRLRLEQIVQLLPGLLGFIKARFFCVTLGSSARGRLEVLTEVGNFFFYGRFRSIFEAAGGVCGIKVFAHAAAVQFVKTLIAGGLAAEGKWLTGETGAAVKTVQIVQSAISPWAQLRIR